MVAHKTRKNRKQRGGMPLSYTNPGYREPSAPAGLDKAQVHTGLILRQGLPMTQGGGRRRRTVRGGFYPSIMGGVVQNAPLLAAVALRQGLNLFAKYRKSRGSARKTRRRRSSGRRA
jgi:hypothetical protein